MPHLQLERSHGQIAVRYVMTLESLLALRTERGGPPWQELVGQYRLSVSSLMPDTAGPIISGDLVMVPKALDDLRWPRPWNPPAVHDREFAAILAWIRSSGVTILAPTEPEGARHGKCGGL